MLRLQTPPSEKSNLGWLVTLDTVLPGESMDREAWQATVHWVKRVGHSLATIPIRKESEVSQLCPTLCNPMDCSLPGSSRQKYWSGLPFPSPGDIPNPGIKPRSHALQADALLSRLQLAYLVIIDTYKWIYMGFPGGSHGKESACNAGDLGSIPGLGRSPGEGNSYPLQCSGLENSMDRGAWQTIIHEVTKSWIWLSAFHFHCHKWIRKNKPAC